MKQDENVKSVGTVEINVEHKNGMQETFNISNIVLKTGRETLAKVLANEIGDSFKYFVTNMLFGDGGSETGVKRYVNPERNGLFGITRLSKPAISNVNANLPSQVIFTSVITFDELNAVVLNEMALQLADGNLYSMTTFPDLTKTSEMQITFNWRLNFV